MPDAELFDHLARRRHHPTRCIDTAAQCFKYALATERNRLDGRRTLRDAQDAHDVETATAGARDRARPPQRGNRC